jgi:UDP-glucose 4-epimerase
MKTKSNSKSAIVTGGAGFIGSHLVDKLVDLDYEVTVIDNLQAGRETNLDNVREKINFINGDVSNEDSFAKLPKNVEIIFHIAANASVPYSVDNPKYDFETNALGTFNVLNYARKNDVKKIVYASTAAVYGSPIYTPIDENHPLNPVSPYGASKLAGERLGFAYRNTYDMDFAAVRIFNTWGPRQPRYVLYDFVQKLKKNPSLLEVLGDGTQIRDYCYVSDTVNAFLVVAEKGNGVYNIAGGEPVSIKELAEIVVAKISPGAKITYGGERWKGDIDTLVADISKIKNLGFKPNVRIKGDELNAHMLLNL